MERHLKINTYSRLVGQQSISESRKYASDLRRMESNPALFKHFFTMHYRGLYIYQFNNAYYVGARYYGATLDEAKAQVDRVRGVKH